ncbi:MAG TPA: VOC family protein [Desulfuromonadales bacterium]|nr:VOC family protein [Desulfuromonadales bacterium]
MTPKLLINIDVDDLERGVAFYTQALDLRRGRTLFDGTAVELTGAASPVYLLLKPAGTLAAGGVRQRRRYRRHWTPVHLDFVVADVAAAVARAVAAGARLEGAIASYGWGRLATLADPFGNGFCLVEFHGGGY